jgi:glycosyltransferase involved in cell wall biosynthesis
MNTEFSFPGTTLLITHYNRSRSLERLLGKLTELKCNFDDIVVSDDASADRHQEKLKGLQDEYHFNLVTTPINKGLGNCLNKGQDAVKTPYTLYVQEDFQPSALFPPRLANALEIMEERTDLDYIRFWSLYRFPCLKPYRDGFAEMFYNPWNMNHLSFFMYSDNPHLRRSNFFEKFGRYQEGTVGDITEHNMCIRFIQRNGKGLFYEDYASLFEHEHLAGEPSTFNRAGWRQSRHPFFLLLRAIYLRYKCVKCMWQVKFMR